MRREQFTFYRSFWEALLALPKREQLPFVLALCAYALDGEEKDLGGAAASSFCLVKPVLDTARRKAQSGKQGGSRPKANGKQTESKTQANGKQTESKTQASGKQTESKGEKEKEKEKEKEIEIETEGEIENECLYTPPAPSDDGDAPLPGGPVVGVVFAERLESFTARARSELDDFEARVGPEVCMRALETAEDAGKPNWGYVRGILRIKAEQGVRSLEDWDRLERQREAGKRAAVGMPRDVQPSAERIQKNADWLDRFLGGLEGGGTA